MKRRKTLCVILLVGALYSCSKKSNSAETGAQVDCSGPAKSFLNDVSPVLQASCAISSGCHGNGSSSGDGPLVNYSQVFNARSSIRTTVASGHMPLNGSLTASQKNAILCWIDSGAPNN